MAQTITKKPGEDIIIVDEMVDPAPTPGDCECDVQAGTTTTLAAGSPATVTSRKVNKTHFFDFGIPQGAPGQDGGGTAPPGSNIILGKGNINPKDWAFNADGSRADYGDGNFDASIAIMRAWDQIKGTGGKIHIDIPNNFYNVKTPCKIWPVQGSGDPQIWCSIEAVGGEASKGFRYTGAGNSPVFDFMGNNSGEVRGLRIGIDGGKSNVACVLVRTNLQSQSVKNVAFHDCYFTLGAGANQGFKFIKSDPLNNSDNGDISLFEFFGCKIYGGRYPNPPIAGSIAYQSQAANCLAMNVWGGFVETCDNIFNATGAGPDASRGGACWNFVNVHTSHNGCNYVLDREGTLTVTGSRMEVDRQICKTTNGNQHRAIHFTNIRSDHMVNGSDAFDMKGGFSLVLDNIQVGSSGILNSLVAIEGNGISDIDIRLGASRSTQLTRRIGGPLNTKLYMNGHKKFQTGGAIWIEDRYNDENGKAV